MKPDTVMIFAAGLGTRMRPLSDTMPKPLIPVAGRAMIDRALDLADQAGLKHVVVNTHYLAPMLHTHLAHHQNLRFSDEPEAALETGGGLKHALPLLGEAPVFTMNPDAIWTGPNPFNQLARAWRPREMDALLLLAPLARAVGHGPTGDFSLGPDQKIARDGPRDFVYTGVQILRTEELAAISEQKFSLNILWDRMIADGRLLGCIHQGGWAAVGTPQAIGLAEAHLRETGNV